MIIIMIKILKINSNNNNYYNLQIYIVQFQNVIKHIEFDNTIRFKGNIEFWLWILSRETGEKSSRFVGPAKRQSLLEIKFVEKYNLYLPT